MSNNDVERYYQPSGLLQVSKPLEIFGIQDYLTNWGDASQKSNQGEQDHNAPVNPKPGRVPGRAEGGRVEQEREHEIQRGEAEGP